MIILLIAGIALTIRYFMNAHKSLIVIDLISNFESVEILSETYVIDFDEESPKADKIFKNGWSFKETSNGNSYRWTNAISSSIQFFVINTKDIVAHFQVNPLSYQNCPLQFIKIELNNRFLQQINLKKEWSQYKVKIPSEYLKVGFNEMKFTYNYVQQPKQHNISDDERNLAVDFDYIAFYPDRSNASYTVDWGRAIQKNLDRQIDRIPSINDNVLYIPGSICFKYLIKIPKKAILTFKVKVDPLPQKKQHGSTLSIWAETRNSQMVIQNY